MPVGNVAPPQTIYPIKGVKLGITAAGVRYQNRDDLVVIELPEYAKTAVVTTQNKCCAAPVTIVREHLAALSTNSEDRDKNKSNPRYLVINTGNANAATGEEGYQRALSVCQALATKTNNLPEQILPFSTGVIGEVLNHQAIINSLEDSINALDENNWLSAANAIRTTDTVPKIASKAIYLSASDSAHRPSDKITDINEAPTYHVTGISKGSGMIRPNMATMLGFVATDANIAPDLLKEMLRKLTEATFNRITVDGDTSTNDCCALIATGNNPLQYIDNLHHPHYEAVYETLLAVFKRLATLIIRDGEGSTKFITVSVTGGATTEDCCKVAYAVAHSPLVKTAFFASDPNWGRILAAVGYSGAKNLDANNVSISLDNVAICTRGQLDDKYREAKGQDIMNRPEITIHIDLGAGTASDTVYTCDLSHDYVSINADYRS